MYKKAFSEPFFLYSNTDLLRTEIHIETVRLQSEKIQVSHTLVIIKSDFMDDNGNK